MGLKRARYRADSLAAESAIGGGGIMATRTWFWILIAGFCLSACAGGPSPGGITTGSILPSLPALPSASSLVPSFGATTATSRRPERVSGNLYRLPASDRRIADRIERDNYDMLRAAEATRTIGGTHFVIVALNGPATDAPFSGGGAVVSGGTLVRVLQVQPGSETPVGAVSVEEILHFFGPQFGREPPPGLPANPSFPSEPAAPAQPPQLRGT
jgi:hypothetical protein